MVKPRKRHASRRPYDVGGRRLGGTEMLENAVSPLYKTGIALDDNTASESLDSLMYFVSDLLPVDAQQYPSAPLSSQSDAINFCLHHSALHFSKTAGRLAAFVEDADHGHFAKIQTLEGIVAASIVNSLKLAEEIGLTGSEIMQAVKAKFAVRDQEVLQR